MSLSLLSSLSRGRSDRKRAVVDVVVLHVDILRKEDGCCCIQALEEARQLIRKTPATNAHVLLVLAGEVLIIVLLFIIVCRLWIGVVTEFWKPNSERTVVRLADVVEKIPLDM
jgi:hypothetical protein